MGWSAEESLVCVFESGLVRTRLAFCTKTTRAAEVLGDVRAGAGLHHRRAREVGGRRRDGFALAPGCGRSAVAD